MPASLRAALAAVLIAAAPAFCAAADGLRDLPSGRYELKLSGFLCWACARAVAQELSGIKGVSAVSPDFDRQAVGLTVEPGREISASKIRRALRRAEKLVNLDAHYEVRSVSYQVVPIIPGVPDGQSAPGANNKARL